MGIGSLVSAGMTGKQTKQAMKDQKAAYQDLTRRMETSQQDYLARRPEVQEERMRALRTQLGMMAPSNNFLSEMSGGKYALDLQTPGQQSPVSMRPLQSQLGEAKNGGYDPATLAALKAQGYDLSGIAQANRNPLQRNQQGPAEAQYAPEFGYSRQTSAGQQEPPDSTRVVRGGTGRGGR